MKIVNDCRDRLLVIAMVALSLLTGCHATKTITGTGKTEKVLLGEFTRDWLKYRLYLMPEKSGQMGHNKVMQLSIMVENMMDNASPLRKLCTNLDDYNTYYEYLLNGAKNEIYLQSAKSISYPISYSFENNYNVFPFETINVGYRTPDRKKGTQLVYIDRVFSRDTLYFPIKL